MGYLVLTAGLLISVALAAASYFSLKTEYPPALLAFAVLTCGTLILSSFFCVFSQIYRRRSQQLLRENHNIKLLLEHGSSAMLLLNTDIEPLYINHRHDTLERLKYSTTQNLIDLQHWEKNIPLETRLQIGEAIANGQIWRGELQFGNDGQDEYLSTTISPVLNHVGELCNIVVCGEDISEHKAVADRLFIREHYNVLTGLPNRQFALRNLHSTIDKCTAKKTEFILIHVDLDRIRYINETLGHFIVDKVFIETAERLRRCVHDDLLLAHLGADEFLFILDVGMSHEEAGILANTLLEQCRTSFYIEQHEITISASIGLSQFPHDGDDGPSLMRRAEVAMFEAKAQGGDRFCFYNEHMSDQAGRRLEIENQLRHAIHRDELELYYQPVIDLNKHQLVGVEALLRWKNEALGNPGPDEFIHIAEQSGQIITIGNWVLEQACKQAMTWSKAGLPKLNVAVNISGKQFIDGDLLANVSRVLSQSGLPASQLELEITEGLLLNDTPLIRNIFQQLKSLGVHLSLDDFGTGYASLSYLKRYPFDTLKIDRSFIHDIDQHQDSITLTNAIITMAHSFNMRVIAEGVENLDQRRILREHHCDLVQGFLYSPPLPASTFLTWAKRYDDMQHSKHI